MNNFIDTFKSGKAGKNFGLTTGIPPLDKAIHGIQRKHSYGIGAAQKVGKCLALGTKVIMYDLSSKNVESLQIGDTLLGIDGKPNSIISITSGEEQMYWIHQSKAMSYRVNESHILSLKKKDGTIKHISVKDFLKLSWKNKKRNAYGYKSPVIKETIQVQLSPYFLGLWLGDGSSRNDNITNTDTEVLDWLSEFAIKNGYKMKNRDKITYNFKSTDRYYVYESGNLIKECRTLVEVNNIIKVKRMEYISRSLTKNEEFKIGNYRVIRNIQKPLVTYLRDIGVICNKHIPMLYLNNSESIRLELLAGLIDSDGYLGYKGISYEITQKNKRLCEDIKLLCDSLGFNTTLKGKIAYMTREDGSIYSCEVYRLLIKGNVNKIPVKIERKKAIPIINNMNSYISVVKDKVDSYYGFTLSNEDRRFYLEDFTVTHNTTLVDFIFVLSPYIQMEKNGTLDNIEWIYNSYEIDRVSKEFKFAAFFMYHDFGVANFMYKDKLYTMSQDYLMGKLRYTLPDGNLEQVSVSDEHENMLKEIYSKRIIPLFGEYSITGERITKGKIDFIEQAENPTGKYKYLMNYAKENGNFIIENYYITNDSGHKEVKSRITGYTPKNPDKFVIVITDHIRKLLRERGFTMKENIDKWLEYTTWFRNICSFTPVNVCHSNRGLANIERLKYQGEFIFPTADDMKDTGNLAEESTILLTMFNPNDEKYNLSRHFGVELKEFPNYRSIHVADSRYTECPVHIQTNMLGGINMFTKLKTF